jgi:hypothetical protein
MRNDEEQNLQTEEPKTIGTEDIKIIDTLLSKYKPNPLLPIILDLTESDILESSSLSPTEDSKQTERKKLSLFAGQIISVMDEEFDQHRENFEQSLSSDTSTTFEQLMTINVPMDGTTSTIGDLFSLVEKYAGNDSLYPDDNSKALLTNDINFLKNDVMTSVAQTEKNADHATSEEADRLRRITNQGTFQLIFDLNYGHLAEMPNYLSARDRYAGMAIAMQYADDIVDTRIDINKKGINLFLVYAREFDEFDALKKVFESDDFKQAFERGDNIHDFYEIAYNSAPKAYQKMVELQQKELKRVNSPILNSLQSIPDPQSFYQNSESENPEL